MESGFDVCSIAEVCGEQGDFLSTEEVILSFAESSVGEIENYRSYFISCRWESSMPYERHSKKGCCCGY